METSDTRIWIITKAMRLLSLAAAMLFIAPGAWAANQNSNWQAAGSGDMATPSNWSLGDATYWADTQGEGNYVTPTFAPISPYTPLTFTASSDLTFSGFWFHQGASYSYQEYILDPGADRTISFNGTADASIWLGVNSGKRALVRFKSGTYKIRDGATGKNSSFRHTTTSGGVTSVVESASTRIEFGAINFNGYLGNMLCVTNGGYLRGTLSMGGSGANLRDGVFLVSGRDPATGTPSIFDENNGNSLIFDNDNGGGSVTMLVNDGGVVTNFYGRWGNRGSNAKMIIDAGGSYYGSNSGGLTLGCNRTGSAGAYTGWPTNNSVTVRNGGFFTMPKTLVIGSEGHDNWVSVESGGEMNVNQIYLGNTGSYQDEQNYGNRLYVSSGAYLNIYTSLQSLGYSFGNEIDIGGAGTRVDIRRDERGTAGGGIILNASNTVMRIHDGAVVTNYEMSAGTRLRHNTRLEVLSGSELYLANGMLQGHSVAGSNSFVLVEGGRIIIPGAKTYELGNLNMTLERDWNNILWIGDGGYLSTYRLRLFGYGNEVVVSNGTLEVGSEFRTTYSNTEESGGRCRVTFAGSRPRFLMQGQYLNFQREGIIRFEIPRGGYETIPFEQTGADSDHHLSIAGNCTAEFDVEEYAKGGGGTLTLMKSNLAITISDDQLNKLREGLPERSTLFLSDDGTELRLKVKPQTGLVLFVR